MPKTMLSKPPGVVVLTGMFLLSAVAGFVAFLQAWPQTSNTSPLMALFALLWSCASGVTALLTWRGSRLAAPAFLLAIGLLLFPASYIVPGGQLFYPAVVVLAVAGFLGFRYLHTARQIA